MKTPMIKIGGKNIPAMPPKTGMWRRFIAMKSSDIDFESEEALDMMIEFIVAAFRNPAVTAEAVEAELDLEEFFPLFGQIGEWMRHRMEEKMKADPDGGK
jgi:hypothetical protein